MAENEFRKDFTPSERVAIGEAIEAEIKVDADKRMKSGVENPVENFPQGGKKTRYLAAAKAGFGSGKTLEAARRAGRTSCAFVGCDVGYVAFEGLFRRNAGKCRRARKTLARAFLPA